VFNEAFEQYFGAPKANTDSDSSKANQTSQEDTNKLSPQELGEQLSQAIQAQPELAANLSSELG
jgi:hypothetical protein